MAEQHKEPEAGKEALPKQQEDLRVVNNAVAEKHDESEACKDEPPEQ